MWTEPVCDRSEADIAGRTAKGFCNAGDLNRLEQNSLHVAELLGVLQEPRGRAWARADFPTESELERILRNLRVIRERYTPYLATPQTPLPPLNHWQRWNAAEQILRDTRASILDNREAWNRGSELFSGETIGVI